MINIAKSDIYSRAETEYRAAVRRFLATSARYLELDAATGSGKPPLARVLSAAGVNTP